MKISLRLGTVAMAILSACGSPESTPAETEQPDTQVIGKLWVTSDRLDRHSCPAATCGIVGQLFFREGATPLEEKDGWVRISEPYAALCENGINEYVDVGNNACTEENGVVGGDFSEWVQRAQLSETRPPDPAETAQADETLVAYSDDFAQHRDAFTKLAAQLIQEGRCSAADFREQGGFMKSVNEYPDEPVYFTYCGGMHLSNKVYVNAETVQILR